MNRILIIEDEPRISSFIAKGLKAAGFTTLTVATAEEGRAQAMTATFDLIILDLSLPDGDGYSVLTAVRSLGLHIPVIILTARNSVDDTVTGLQSGADDYMPKPFHFDELLARVQLRLRADSDQMISTAFRYCLSGQPVPCFWRVGTGRPGSLVSELVLVFRLVRGVLGAYWVRRVV